jgi:hypothetical protein
MKKICLALCAVLITTSCASTPCEWRTPSGGMDFSHSRRCNTARHLRNAGEFFQYMGLYADAAIHPHNQKVVVFAMTTCVTPQLASGWVREKDQLEVVCTPDCKECKIRARR